MVKENLFLKFLKYNFNAIKISFSNSEIKVMDEEITDDELNKSLAEVEKMEIKQEKIMEPKTKRKTSTSSRKKSSGGKM